MHAIKKLIYILALLLSVTLLLQNKPSVAAPMYCDCSIGSPGDGATCSAVETWATCGFYANPIDCFNGCVLGGMY